MLKLPKLPVTPRAATLRTSLNGLGKIIGKLSDNNNPIMLGVSHHYYVIYINTA